MNSRLCVLGGPHIWGGGSEFDSLFKKCVLGDFLGGGDSVHKYPLRLSVSGVVVEIEIPNKFVWASELPLRYIYDAT